jgi:aspartate aminotransferase
MNRKTSYNNKRVSLNLNVRGIGKSPTLAINERCRKLAGQGRIIHRLGLGQSPFPVPVPVVEALKNHAHEKDYLNVNGLEALRRAVARFHARKDQVDIRPGNVLIGPGSKELMFLLQLVYYGEIILPTPCWVSYAPQAKIIGRNIKYIHTDFKDGWKITPKKLETFLRKDQDQYKPRILVLNYPANPTGLTYSEPELKALARIAKKFEMVLLSDEIYGQLHFQGGHVSIARFYPEGTIISSGLSKWCGAGGWRLGTFAFPASFEWLLDPMAAVASETYTSVSAPIQHAAVRAFKGGILIERYLWHARRILSYLGARTADILINAGIRVHRPEGGFYLFLDFSPHAENLQARGVTDSVTLCEKLLDETGVAILPGEAFMRPPEELSARLAYVNFDGPEALATSETVPLSSEIPESMHEACFGPVFQAIEAIVDWVRG